jgi:hypothetical protein
MVAFPHLVLQARIRFSELFGAFFDLLLESLLVKLLLFDVGTGAEPLLDDAMLVAQRNGAIEIPAIALDGVCRRYSISKVSPVRMQASHLSWHGALSSG